jgi:hypothetical protein
MNSWIGKVTRKRGETGSRRGLGQCLGEEGRSDQVTAPPRWEDIPYVGGGNPVKRSCMWEIPCSCPASEEGCRRLR